jgi:hypothetical protein
MPRRPPSASSAKSPLTLLAVTVLASLDDQTSGDRLP